LIYAADLTLLWVSVAAFYLDAMLTCANKNAVVRPDNGASEMALFSAFNGQYRVQNSE
jgi:hypothetical protein